MEIFHEQILKFFFFISIINHLLLTESDKNIHLILDPKNFKIKSVGLVIG